MTSSSGSCWKQNVNMRRTRNTVSTFSWQTRKTQSTCSDKTRPDFPRICSGWKRNGARQMLPMDSLVLEPAVKESLLADCRDFLRSEDWYVHYSEFTEIRAHMRGQVRGT